METQCSICKKTFDDSTMWKSEVYYNITKEAEESRRNGLIPFEFGRGIVKVIDELHISEEMKEVAKQDLKHNYELRVLSYCENCAPVANFMRVGPSS